MEAAFRARISSTAPSDREVTDKTPMAYANSGELISHIIVAVRPTDAEAFAPIAPTWAVSAYWTMVCRACSMTVGQASRKMVRIISLSRRVLRIDENIEYSSLASLLKKAGRKLSCPPRPWMHEG